MEEITEITTVIMIVTIVVAIRKEVSPLLVSTMIPVTLSVTIIGRMAALSGSQLTLQNIAIYTMDIIAKAMFGLLAYSLFDYAQAFRYTRKPHHILIPAAVTATLLIHLIQHTQATTLSFIAVITAATAMLILDPCPATPGYLNRPHIARKLGSTKVVIVHTPDIKTREYAFITTRLTPILKKEITIEPISIPNNCYDSEKQTYLLTPLINHLQNNTQNSPLVLLTRQKLNEILDAPNILGCAWPSKQVAVISLENIRKNTRPTQFTTMQALTEQLLDTIVHETLHLYGLHHCRHTGCSMHHSTKDSDDNELRTEPSLCQKCSRIFEAKRKTYCKIKLRTERSITSQREKLADIVQCPQAPQLTKQTQITTIYRKPQGHCNIKQGGNIGEKGK